jgi:predicted kinase
VSGAEEVSVGAADSRSDLIERDELRAGKAVSSLERRLEQLPDSHPASPRYARDTPAPAADARPLTDAEYAEHVDEVRMLLDEAREAGLATDHQFTVDAKRRIWSDERDALHDEIVADLYARSSEVPRGHEAILAGGLPGSGKTTVLTEHAGIDLTRYLMINPDLIKEEMACRGLVPEVEGLSPMEASDLVHEESSRIAKRLAHRAQGDGVNVIWDVTMSDEQSTAGRLESLRGAGYTRVEAIFVDISVEVSARRADARHREGHDDYRMGIGQGGRYVPPELILNQAVPDWGSQNRQTFESLKRRFDAWSRYDNSVDGRAPTVAETSKDAHPQERIDD